MKDVANLFLGSVADYYLNRDDIDLAGLWMVLPNKRAVIFMRRYLRKVSIRQQVMPELLTIGAFNERICPDYETADRVTLLFKLYAAYMSVMSEMGLNAHPFSRFAYWGDMILNDFDQIDESLVDADKLYRNMNEYLEIKSSFLSVEQIEALRSILGREAADRLKAQAESEEFWLHIKHAYPVELDELERETEDSVYDYDNENPRATHKSGRRFRHLWEILGHLYRTFVGNLDNDGEHLTYGGLLTRKVYERIRDGKSVPACSRVAFIGFGNMSLAQGAMMKELQKLGMADFFWDTLDPVRLGKMDGGRFSDLVKAFSMPADYTVPRAVGLPQVNIVGVPSNFLQTKIVGQTLESWNKRKFVKPVFPDDTLVMLPDTSLLSAVIHGLPDIKVVGDYNIYNISMGLSFRQTPFATLLRAIVSLQAHLRNVRGELMFMREDVAALGSLPQFAALFPEAVQVLNTYLREHAVFNIPASELLALPGAEDLKPFFVEIRDTHSVTEISRYVYGFIDALDAALCRQGGDKPGDAQADRCAEYKNVDKTAEEIKSESATVDAPVVRHNEERVLTAYRESADRIFQCLEKYRIGAVNEVHLLNLVERIMAVSQLNMHGTPVHGIQILGALETRALDFDNIIVTSMNEHVMPRRARMRSLIPQSFRQAYYLPTTESVDNEYAYYFLRLLNRAKRVTCLYDSRPKGLSAGAMSRYALQLKLMSPPGMVRMFNVSLNAEAEAERTIAIPKDNDEVRTLLRGYTDPEHGYNLSASALKTYQKCPLQFYLKNVRGINEENELTEYVDSATYGTIIHRTLQNIYNEMSGANLPYRVSDARLKYYIDNPDKVEGHVRNVMMREYYKERMPSLNPDELPGEGMLLSELMADYVVATLKRDYRRLVDNNPEQFWFEQAEARFNTLPDPKAQKVGQWQVAPGLSINVRMDIDRIDRVRTADGQEMLRFIDYKTGGDINVVASLTDLIPETVGKKGGKKADGMFQLLLYCMWYCELTGYRGLIRPTLYRLQKAFSSQNSEIENFEHDGIYVKKISADSPLVWCGDPGDDPRYAWQNEFRDRVRQMVCDIFDTTGCFGQADWSETCNYCMFRNICRRPEKDLNY